MKPQHKPIPTFSIPVLCIILAGLFTQHTNAQCNVKVSFKDTVCWSDAHNYGINFIAKQSSSADFYSWNFGDPNSGPQNIANFYWTPNHRFTAGPGVYLVTFSMHTPSCGTVDTCFFVHIMGPEAIIDLSQITSTIAPFPVNNYYPATRMNRSMFIAVNSNKSGCGPQTVTYITFKHNSPTPKAHIKYQYCNATVLNETADTIKDCYGGGKIPYVTSVTLKPTDSTISYYYDSTEVTHTWTKGSTIPSGIVYYPSTGTLTWNAMHDSNLVTCQLPNLVRFTNNSIKYRLHAAIDDNTFLNVLNPTHSFQDTCLWKNYPMASDSLSYYWSFNDPSGLNCTSSASNQNWDCNYSTLAAPYHYYKGKYGLPASGCQTVNLKVTDAVTGCSDNTNLTLKQGPPRATWDKSAYCKMTWEMQEYDLAPRGAPGASGPPLIGFMLDQQVSPCAGPQYPFGIDFQQTIPTCGATNWWVVFDSANVAKYVKCPSGDSALDYGFTGDLGPGYSPGRNGYPSGAPAAFWENPPYFGRYWYNVGDTGCKTIGIVLQVGNCFDTCWYHDYICFNNLDANFNIYNVSPVQGAVKSQVFVDSSESGHGHVCQGGLASVGTNHITEGVRLYLFPKDTNQRDVTFFNYNITRNAYGDNPDYTNNGGQWYYDYAPYGTPIGFWPDSATLNPFTSLNDSLKQIQNTISYIDTPHAYIIISSPGLTARRVLLNFPFYQNEIDSLKAKGQVNISMNDFRARRISADCGKAYITVYSDPGFTITHQAKTFSLGGPRAVDSLTIPYPGFYTITATENNLEGCTNTSQYYLIYGHYATFWVDDSIICLGQPVTVHWYVRYWSTNCPPRPNGLPNAIGCLNGSDEVPGLSNTVDFAPWDALNPTAYRDSLTSGLAPSLQWKNLSHPGYQPESVALNFGVDTVFHVVPNQYKNSPATSAPFIYAKPGVYTITMRTIDWRGCTVYTRRKNFIKVIKPSVSFALANPTDTVNNCAPRAIKLVAHTSLPGATYKDKVVKNGKIIDSAFTVDSIVSRVWTPGDGSAIVQLKNDTMTFDYTANGKFTVGLKVQTHNGCADSFIRPNYITITGPNPKFVPLSPLSGCAPFTVHVKNYNPANAESNTWNFGDAPGNSQMLTTNPPADSLVSLTYNASSGRYRLSLTQTDTFTQNGAHQTCTATWPLASDPVQYLVNINPDGSLKINAKTNFLFFSTPDTLTAISDHGEYKKYNWNFGNDTTKIGVTDSVQEIRYSMSDFNAAPKNSKNLAIFIVKVSGITDSGCMATDSFTILNSNSGINETNAGLAYLNVYPNPFNSTATVEYSLDKRTDVTLELTDVTGRQIVLSTSASQSPGKYQFDIDADKYHLTPGVYILKVTLENGFVSRDIVKF